MIREYGSPNSARDCGAGRGYFKTVDLTQAFRNRLVSQAFPLAFEVDETGVESAIWRI